MALTVTSCLATLGGLSITGARNVSRPPATMGAADLPLAWCRIPEGTQEVISFSGQPEIDRWAVDLVVACEVVGVNINSVNHALVATVMDNVNAALKAEALANTQIDAWTMAGEIEQIGDSYYWMVITTVEMSE